MPARKDVRPTVRRTWRQCLRILNHVITTMSSIYCEPKPTQFFQLLHGPLSPHLVKAGYFPQRLDFFLAVEEHFVQAFRVESTFATPLRVSSQFFDPLTHP